MKTVVEYATLRSVQSNSALGIIFEMEDQDDT